MMERINFRSQRLITFDRSCSYCRLRSGKKQIGFEQVNVIDLDRFIFILATYLGDDQKSQDWLKQETEWKSRIHWYNLERNFAHKLKTD